MKFMKKGVLLLVVLILALSLSGCLDYKSYTGDSQVSEDDLLKELAQIESELGVPDEPAEDNIAEDTVKEDTTQKVEIDLDEKPSLSDLDRIIVKENELVTLDVNIDDPDADQIDYSFSAPLDKKGKWQTSYGDAGEYVITITASDKRSTTTKDILLVVERVNVPPVIKPISDIAVLEGETVKLDPQVSDPNGDSVTVSLSEPLASGVWNTDHTSAGEYVIVVTVSDGELDSEESFLLTVKDVNVLPEITGLNDLRVSEGEIVELQPQVTDLDNDVVKTTIEVVCISGCQFLSPGDIAKSCDRECIWQTSYTDHGVYKVKVSAYDGKEKAEKEATLTIEDQNQPPVIGDIQLG